MLCSATDAQTAFMQGKEYLMNHSIKSSIAAAVLAIGALGASAVANASTAVHLSVSVPAAIAAPSYVQPQPSYVVPARTVHMPPQVVYDEPHSYSNGWRYEHGRNWRSSCRAPGWDPNARYMPGQRVWHNGYLFVATPLSASVWNVNSPPEWTPGYWAPARCR
jgi:hypothetical protein